MDGGEFLQTSHTPETQHGPFSSSERQVRILDTVVEPPARLLLFAGTQASERRLMGSETICDDLFGATVPLHQFLEDFQCCSFVSEFANNRFQHPAFVINSPPKIMPLTIHLHENLVDVPFPF